MEEEICEKCKKPVKKNIHKHTRYCELCIKLTLSDIPLATHFGVINTFYMWNREGNDLCDKCFEMWGVK